MADSDRVAGIYSEVKYRFDRKSIQTLRKFKRDLMELKSNLRDVKKLTRGNVKIGFTAKNAKVTQQVAKQSKEVKKDSVDTARVLGKQNKLRENSVKLQANLARKQKDASDAAVTKSGKVWKQREKFEKFQRDASDAEVKRAGKVWKQRQAMEEWMANQQRIQRDAKKKELDLRSKEAQQIRKIRSMRTVSGGNLGQDDYRKAIQQVRRYGRALRDGTVSSGHFGRATEELNKKLREQTRVARQTTMSFNQMRTAVASATGAYSAYAGAVGVGAVGGQFESARIMLETAVGAEEAGQTMQFLIDQSQRLGIAAENTAKGFARYSLAGKELGFTTAELQEQFLGIAEAGVVFGLRQDEMTGVLRALEQMMS